ncbi:MAG: ABC transporter substrate-binding protein [Solirubrobacterales bacterium]
MRRVAASLAAALLALAAAGCGEDGAEPGAPRGATLVLDFQPNAVHSGIYAARARGFFEEEGLELEIREPSGTADGAKLLEAGRTDFAILDINDFGIARVRGLDLVAIAAIVQRPLAAVIAGDRKAIRTPADLAGKTVGVTGVPSDDAVLDTVLRSGGRAPDSVERVTIGFNAVSALAARRIDAATGFWNAEGVELAQRAVPVREFRVDRFGAPRYPELVLVARREAVPERPDPGSVACAALRGLQRGYAELLDDPNRAIEDLVEAVPGADADAQGAQMAALVAARAFSRPGKIPATPSLDPGAIAGWGRWTAETGLLGTIARGGLVAEGFRPKLLPACARPGREAASPSG